LSCPARSREAKHKGNAPRPGGRQRFFDDAEAFVGVEELVRRCQNPDMLGNGARAHAEKEEIAGLAGLDRNGQHQTRGPFGEDLALPGLAPIPAVGRDWEWLGPDNLAPDTAREAEAVAADPAQAGLVMVGRAEP